MGQTTDPGGLLRNLPHQTVLLQHHDIRLPGILPAAKNLRKSNNTKLPLHLLLQHILQICNKGDVQRPLGLHRKDHQYSDRHQQPYQLVRHLLHRDG